MERKLEAAMRSGGGKESMTNAVAAFHHVVAKGDLERVKDFVLVRPHPVALA